MNRIAGFALALCLALGLAGCHRERAVAPVPRAEDAPLIPRKALFGNPERAQARISPKGDFISFLAPFDGYMNVYVVPVGAPLSQAHPITRDARRGIREHLWAANGTHVLYRQDEGGDENWHVHSVEIATGLDTDLTPLKGVQARIFGVSRGAPNQVLVGLNDRDPKWHDVYAVDVVTGERTLVYKNADKFSDFVPDRNNALRLAVKGEPSGAEDLYARDAAGGAWSKILAVPFEDTLSTMPIAFEKSGESFLMFDSMGRDKAALVRVELASGKKTVIGESERADVSDVWIDPVTYEPEAFASEYLKTEWIGLDDQARADIAFLHNKLKGEPEVVSRTDDDSKWIVVEDGPTAPQRVHLYDRASRKLTLLFQQRPALADAPLQPMIPEEIPSSDGQTLVSYLTLPPGAQRSAPGRPAKPGPLVIVVHGGPWARDHYGYMPSHQWLANRKYAVLSVNFRGSTGFGKAFVNLGNREWGGAMERDLLDAAKWAVDQGIARPDKIAIMGDSYGGYAVLAGLAFSPTFFACGVDVVGPSNLRTLLDSVPAYWEGYRAGLYLRVGDPRTPEGQKLLDERSPLGRAADISRPLLIGQGANDPRVKPAESEQIVAAMKAKNLPVTYVVYPDEGHGFAQPQNRTSFYAVAEGFLQKCLGGRAEPIGRDFEGASLAVKAGADLVPGLAQALAAPPQAPQAAPDPARPAPDAATPAPKG